MMTTAASSPKVSVRAADPPRGGGTLRVSSDSFNEGGVIPMEHVFTGCGGKNVTPQLTWSGAPDGTKSYAITCFDPDAPTGSGYWHWAAFNLRPSVTSLRAGDGNAKSPGGGKAGYNDFGQSTYCGPCPPKGDGEHHYTFTVYALDVDELPGVDGDTTGATVVFNMRGHVLAQGSITGKFGY
jgi:Raf kinase inhibitor-like YbhB/YbcL family protein